MDLCKARLFADEQLGEHSHRRRQCKRGFGKHVTETVRYLNFKKLLKVVTHLVDFGKIRFAFVGSELTASVFSAASYGDA